MWSWNANLRIVNCSFVQSVIKSSSIPTLFEDHNESITIFKFESSFHNLRTWSICIGNWTNLSYSFFYPERKKNLENAIFESMIVFLNLTNLPASLRFQLEHIGLESVVFCFQPQQQCLQHYVSDLISFCEISSS